MKLLPARYNPHKTVTEVVRRLFVNGAILDKSGQRLVQVEMCDMHTTAFAYASAETLPEIAGIVDGEAYRCQLRWEKSKFPTGWRILGVAGAHIRGDAAFELVPRTRIQNEDHVVPLGILIDCIVEPALRRFLSDVLSDRNFVMRYFDAPINSLGYAHLTEGPIGPALKAITHYWYAPGLTDKQKQLGAIALLFAEPGLVWITNGGQPSGQLDQRPQFPDGAVRYLTRVEPRWWRMILTLWADHSGQPIGQTTYVPPVMKAAYYLALAHARTVDYMQHKRQHC